METSLSPSSLPLSADGLKPFACNICVQRKVKCNKRFPCSACQKTRLQCVYRTEQAAGRKRKALSSNDALLETLQQHESTLYDTQLPLAAFDASAIVIEDQPHDSEERAEQPRPSALPVGSAQLPHRRILVPENGGLRYYEHGFIGILGQQYRQGPEHGTVCDASTEAQQIASEEMASSMFTGVPSPADNLPCRPIPPATVMKYWEIFLNNVHPLTKIVHPPTDHHIMLEGNPSRSMSSDALRYSIYACAIASLTEKVCQTMFSNNKSSLLHQFQSASRHKLLEASFLRVPDSSLLRAQVLLLTSMLQTSDSSSLWILMGSIMRMAQSQGLHRDGVGLGLSPFETERRRRLWWYIFTLDGRLTELTGSESTLPKFMDTLLPSNVNDDDLEPAMKIAPLERIGSSEMTFCLVHYEAARFLAENDPRYDESERRWSSRLDRPGDRRSASELENFLQEQFFRFCDPVVPIQFLAILLARSNLCKFRQMEHRRMYQSDPDDTSRVSLGKSNITLNIAVRNIEYDNLIHSNRSLRGFLWHVQFYFPWGAPIYILKDLAFHPDWDEEMQAAWERIQELHRHHPEYKDSSKIQHLIIGGLTIKAWAAREALLQSGGISKPSAPAIISELQIQQAPFLTRHHDFSSASTKIPNEALNYIALGDFDFTNFDLMDPTFVDIDWSGWNGY